MRKEIYYVVTEEKFNESICTWYLDFNSAFRDILIKHPIGVYRATIDECNIRRIRGNCIRVEKGDIRDLSGIPIYATPQEEELITLDIIADLRFGSEIMNADLPEEEREIIAQQNLNILLIAQEEAFNREERKALVLANVIKYGSYPNEEGKWNEDWFGSVMTLIEMLDKPDDRADIMAKDLQTANMPAEKLSKAIRIIRDADELAKIRLESGPDYKKLRLLSSLRLSFITAEGIDLKII